MYINLRDISTHFEQEVNKVKQTECINTNSKAVEYCVVNHYKNLEEIKQLKKELYDTRQDLTTYKMKLYSLRDLLKWVNNLT